MLLVSVWCCPVTDQITTETLTDVARDTLETRSSLCSSSSISSATSSLMQSSVSFYKFVGLKLLFCQIISCPSENVLTVDESLQHGSMWGDHDVMFKEWKLYRRLISNMYSCVQHYISIRDRQINVHVCVRKECINFRLDFATSMCAAVVRIGVKQSDLC